MAQSAKPSDKSSALPRYFIFIIRYDIFVALLITARVHSIEIHSDFFYYYFFLILMTTQIASVLMPLLVPKQEKQSFT